MPRNPRELASVRPATVSDERALAAIDHRTWSSENTPMALWPVGKPFFDAGTRPEDVLVALAGERIGGYLKLRRLTLPASHHVQEINGFAVDPDLQGRGLGRSLLEAARREAVARGARRVTLRALGTNQRAIALYRAAGFREEGRLVGQFLLEGRLVDDVFMTLTLE
jgi:ribosomal protein S18 acetylase RimI-like enzyme